MTLPTLLLAVATWLAAQDPRPAPPPATPPATRAPCGSSAMRSASAMSWSGASMPFLTGTCT